MATKAQKSKVAPKSAAPKQEIMQEETLIEAPIAEVKNSKPKWEIKDRRYYLANGTSPLTFTLCSKHSSRFPLLHFDEETGQQRELRYATNQNSPFAELIIHFFFSNFNFFPASLFYFSRKRGNKL